jgi:DNA-binding MarR family transcriptional regulator
MFTGDNTFFNCLRSIIKKMHQISDRELKIYGLSHAEMRIMLFLYGKNYSRQEEFALAMGIDRTNVGRALKKLENLGYVVRERDPEDARAFTTALTERGWALQNSLEKLKVDIESTVTQGVSSADVRTVSVLLDAMDNNLSWENYLTVKKG